MWRIAGEGMPLPRDIMPGRLVKGCSARIGDGWRARSAASCREAGHRDVGIHYRQASSGALAMKIVQDMAVA